MECARIAAAFAPVIILLLGLGALRWPAWKTAAAGLSATVVIAYAGFAMEPLRIAEAAFEGALLGLFPIVWVVFSALFVYRASAASGGIDRIRIVLSRLSPDRRMQTLLIAFGFGGFLEAAAGFGTAVAIPAGIMIALGFEPMLAAILCLLANTIPVAFGVLGVPVITLAQVTGLPVLPASVYVALQLVPFVVVLPLLLVLLVVGRPREIRGMAAPALASGAVFAALQTFAAWKLGPELPAVLGSLGATATLAAFARLRPPSVPWRFPNDQPAGHESAPKVGAADLLRAVSPFLALLVLILATRTLPALRFLNEPPFTVSLLAYHGTGGKPITFPFAMSVGTLLFVSALLGGFTQGLSLRRLAGAFAETCALVWKPAATILAIVALSKLMSYSGMVSTLAGLFSAAGPVFPFLSPAIGTLGTFLTGSDTSSNVLFGRLQTEAAGRLGLSPDWLAAANASGATAGKMISPQSIAIAVSSTGLSGRENELLRWTLPYCLAYAAALGLLIGSLAQLFTFG